MNPCNADTLVRSVYHTWSCDNLNNVISKVFDRLEKVFSLINEGKGSNDLVESKHGLKYERLKFDHLKNIWYQKEAVIDFSDGIVAEDNVNNDDDGGKVEFEESTV